MKGAYRVALLCGAIPLLTGVSIFLLWLVTRAEWLMVAGVFVLFGGLACFGVGVLALARYCWIALRAPDLPRRFWPATLLCAVALLSNFPAAGLIVRRVIELEARYTVVVRNMSEDALDGVRIIGGSHTYRALTVPGRESVTCTFAIAHEGPLCLEAEGARATIDGYVTSGSNGLAIVSIGPGGQVSVLHGSRD